MAGNLLAEPIAEIIDEQIGYRQRLSGAGGITGVKRDSNVIKYLNNRNAWIKLASGISINDNEDGTNRLKNISDIDDEYFTDKEITNVKSYGLAKNIVLFNTVQSLNDEGTYTKRSGVRNDNKLSNSLGKMYGGLGGNAQGLQPIPGIIDVNIECVNRGSIRKATVNLKAYNRFQFGILETLYLRLGCTMMLEFGWDKYVDSIDENNKPDIMDMGSTIIENSWFKNNHQSQDDIYSEIQKNVNKYKGNYDGFFGKVSNFTWKLNTDNSYDITLNLITMGSVIESLNCKIPAVGLTEKAIEEQQNKLAFKFREADDEEDSTPDNPILNNAGADEFSQFIAATVLNFPYEDYINYIYTPNLVGYDDSKIENKAKIPKDSRYYIRFGKLLEKIQSIAVPFVQNGDSKITPMLKLDLDTETNLCNYQLNLIPLEPSKVIFSVNLDKQMLKRVQPGVLKFYNSRLGSKFAIEKDTLHYGQLLNCYFNLNFISKVLESSKNDKGTVPLFKFLESLCTAINESTGNTTNIEPSIKDDRIVHFIDQNPIKGWESQYPQPQSTPILVTGYQGEDSTFVKDFSFQTKITPDLSAMISISAGSAGSTTKDMNTIPFLNWNKGLEDRFQSKFLDGDITLDANKASPSIEEDVKKSFIRTIKNGVGTDAWDGIGLGSGWGWTFTYKGIKVEDVNTPNTSGKITDADNTALISKGFNLWLEAKKLKDENIKAKKRTQANLQARLRYEKKDSDATIVSKYQSSANNYAVFLANAFGGKTGQYSQGTSFTLGMAPAFAGLPLTFIPYTSFEAITVPAADAKYWYLGSNTDFTDQGVGAFKKYLNDLNQQEFAANGVVSAEGFIPVDLGLTIDGLSGIKIYNRLEVDTKILPSSYPQALNFVATKVNHTISNNVWETKLSTISIPPTLKASPPVPLDPSNQAIQVNNDQVYEVLGPIDYKSYIPLKIIDNRTVRDVPFDSSTYGKEQTAEWLIGEMNIHTQPVWRFFLQYLEGNYPGYTLQINATYRTYQRSAELKALDSDNASPGNSPHNYAYAIDMNVIDPYDVKYVKGVRKPWIESGIVAAAEQVGIRWGGNFNDYVDCVHFDATPVTKASKINAKRDNPGLPQSQWDTKNTNYV
tara:strand:- start:1028 stop:4390 length:3363 start_codon:yes stop_codon:yes gene_type:complete